MSTDDQNIALEVLAERVDRWMETTAGYHTSLCAKLDKMEDKLNDLSCPVHTEKMITINNRLNSHSNNFRAIWTFISAIVLTIFGVFIKGK